MRANRTYGSEGGESQTLLDPYHVLKRKQTQRRGWPGHPRDEVPGGGHDASGGGLGLTPRPSEPGPSRHPPR
jgi:hypothetical protein